LFSKLQISHKFAVAHIIILPFIGVLYSSPDIITQIKSRRMRWVGHVACMGEGRNMYRVLVGRLKETT
jgi:hypothetical protein